LILDSFDDTEESKENEDPTPTTSTPTIPTPESDKEIGSSISGSESLQKTVARLEMGEKQIVWYFSIFF
jgi:hypothetical protein